MKTTFWKMSLVVSKDLLSVLAANDVAGKGLFYNPPLS